MHLRTSWTNIVWCFQLLMPIQFRQITRCMQAVCLKEKELKMPTLFIYLFFDQLAHAFFANLKEFDFFQKKQKHSKKACWSCFGMFSFFKFESQCFDIFHIHHASLSHNNQQNIHFHFKSFKYERLIKRSSQFVFFWHLLNSSTQNRNKEKLNTIYHFLFTAGLFWFFQLHHSDHLIWVHLLIFKTATVSSLFVWFMKTE